MPVQFDDDIGLGGPMTGQQQSSSMAESMSSGPGLRTQEMEASTMQQDGLGYSATSGQKSKSSPSFAHPDLPNPMPEADDDGHTQETAQSRLELSASERITLFRRKMLQELKIPMHDEIQTAIVSDVPIRPSSGHDLISHESGDYTKEIEETPQPWQLDRMEVDLPIDVASLPASSSTDDRTTSAPVEPNLVSAQCSDRMELMQRIKRGESPTWVPNQALKQEYVRLNGELPPDSAITRNSPQRDDQQRQWQGIGQQQWLPLLPAMELRENLPSKDIAPPGLLRSPYEIERPRSALHAGDFTVHEQRENQQHQRSQDQNGPPRTPPPSASSPWSHVTATRHETWDEKAPWAFGQHSLPRSRSRAPSLHSFSSSSYILRTPTTPLVQQSNNTDLDFTSRDRSLSPDKSSRRHTLPVHTFQDWRSSSRLPSASSPPNQHDYLAPPSLARSYRGEHNFPHSHQPRRSITSSWSLQYPSSPPNPTSIFPRSRRTSFSSEASPRQRASMVGSYEESILRGRMSTAPSKPFDFTAHIGALGRGKKPKMPAHITVPFQAVFYDWTSGGRGQGVTNEPSPYVGHIDLKNLNASTSLTTTLYDPAAVSYPLPMKDGHLYDDNMGLMENEAPRKRRRAESMSFASSGKYRIPEQGQIQVVIKNPYKTALKLFLVPYDLAGMQPGQKTFVRQRYYSSGPIIEKPITSEHSPPSSATISGPRGGSGGPKKPILRYLIHLNICCPAKGRYYLYQHVRVVFANRVPDDKEHLTKDVQEPNPKYSSYEW